MRAHIGVSFFVLILLPCSARDQVVVKYHRPIEAAEIKSREGLSQRLRQASRNTQPATEFDESERCT